MCFCLSDLVFTLTLHHLLYTNRCFGVLSPAVVGSLRQQISVWSTCFWSSLLLTFLIPLPDLQTRWPLWANREISTRKPTQEQITQQKKNFSSESSRQEKTSRRVTKGSGVKTTQRLFLVGKQDIEAAKLMWPRLVHLLCCPKATWEPKHKRMTTSARTQTLTAARAFLFFKLTDVRAGCRGSFPDQERCGVCWALT